MRGILLLGAGGHAKVVADILLASGEQVAGFLDDDPATWGTTRLRLPVLGAIDTWADHRPDGLIIAIGSNERRKQIVTFFSEATSHLWCSAIHPRATLAPTVLVGPGTVIMAGAVVNADTIIGAHAIVNTGATIDHDCMIGDYVHIAPGCTLTGGVTVGKGAFIGAGSAILPGKRVGAWSTVGAGAVVVEDVPNGSIVAGVPARVTREAEAET